MSLRGSTGAAAGWNDKLSVLNGLAYFGAQGFVFPFVPPAVDRIEQGSQSLGNLGERRR